MLDQGIHVRRGYYYVVFVLTQKSSLLILQQEKSLGKSTRENIREKPMGNVLEGKESNLKYLCYFSKKI